MGTMATCTGATFGGAIRPLSSECVGPHRARESLAVGLQTRQHRQCEPLLLEPAVHAEDQARLGLRFVRRGVRSMPFLPQELRGAQKQPRAHLPADDVAPLVEQHRQVAVALDPFREHAVDDRLRRRPYDEGFLERGRWIDLDGTLALFACRPQPRMCDERNLLRESFDVLGLLREVAHRDEEREVGVLVAARLDHVVERALHQLPDAVAVRPDHHAPAHGRIVGQLGLGNDVAVPLAEVFGAWCDLLCLSHYSKYPLRSCFIRTFASVPVLRSRTTATFAARSSGPMMIARGAPRAEASSSCL